MKIVLRDGSGTMDLKYLSEEPDRHGNMRIYFRRHGRRVRLRERPGTPEFQAEYERAFRGEAPKTEKPKSPHISWPAGSFGRLVEDYIRHGMASLGAPTRRRRRNELRAICLERFDTEPVHGNKPVAEMRAVHVRRLRDARAETPGTANDRVKALRRMFDWAMEDERIAANPAKEVKYLRAVNPAGWHTWSVEEVRQYAERHPLGTRAYLALCVFLYTGARISDARRFGRQMERGNGAELHYDEVKGSATTHKHHEIPILSPLRAALDACPSGHLTWLVTEFGKPFSEKGLGNRMRKWCDEAGLPHCSAHGLRKAGATIVAENGGTEHQLMAIYGWESAKQAAVYTKAARRKKLAQDAMPLLDLERNGSGIVALSETVPESETIRPKKRGKSKAV